MVLLWGFHFLFVSIYFSVKKTRGRGGEKAHLGGDVFSRWGKTWISGGIIFLDVNKKSRCGS